MILIQTVRAGINIKFKSNTVIHTYLKLMPTKKT
jgi:hypothetical protein